MRNISPIQVQRYLAGIDYPVSKSKLMKKVKDSGADKEVVSIIEQLPEQSFDSPNDVSKAIGYVI
jgi:hypothetical protein